MNNYDLNEIGDTVIKFQGHPSITVFKEQVRESNRAFTFQNVSTDKVSSIVKNVSKTDVISTKIIQEFGLIFAEFLSKPSTVALETTLSMKAWSLWKLFLFSTLSNISKVFERCCYFVVITTAQDMLMILHHF